MSKKIKNSIKTLRLYNFKSYKGLIEIGPFFSGLNSVIGPNGSGKSNLFDSILFVMGKKASQMRFKRLYDIIYLYKSNKDNFASVTMNFNSSKFNNNGRGKIFKEVSFCRKIFSRFSSIYFINGNEISYLVLKKITGNLKFLIKNDRFLIQQGEVEKISSMKPRTGLIQEIGFLEFIEDSLGSTRYVEFLGKRKIVRTNFLKKFPINNLSNKKIIKNYKNIEKHRKNKKFKTLKKVFDIINVIRFKKTSNIIISLKNFFFKQVSLLNAKTLFDITKKKCVYCKKKSIFFSKIKSELLKHQKNLEKNLEKFLQICKLFKQANIKEKIWFYKNQHTKDKNIKRFLFKMDKNKKKCLFYWRLEKLLFRYYLLNRKISNFYVLNHYRMNKFFEHRKNLRSFQKMWLKKLDEFRYCLDFFLISFKKGILKIINFFFFQLKKVPSKKQKIFSKNKKFFYFFKTSELLRDNFDFIKKTLVILELNTFCTKKNRLDVFIKNFRKTQYLYLSNIKKKLAGIKGTIGSSCFTTLFFLFPVLSVLGGEIQSILIDTTRNTQNAAGFFEKHGLNRTRFVIQEKIKSSKNLPLDDDCCLNQKVFEKIYFKKNNLQIFNHFFWEILVVKNLEVGMNIVFKKKIKKKIVTLKGDSIDNNGIFVGGGLTETDYIITHLKKKKPLKWLKDFRIYLTIFGIFENFFINLPQVDNKRNNFILLETQNFLGKKKNIRFLKKFQGFFQLKFYRNFTIRYLLLKLNEKFFPRLCKNNLKKKIKKKNLNNRKNILINSKLSQIVYLMILLRLYRPQEKIYFIKKKYPLCKKKELNSGQDRTTKIKNFIKSKEKKAEVEKFLFRKISFQIVFNLSREFYKFFFILIFYQK